MSQCSKSLIKNYVENYFTELAHNVSFGNFSKLLILTTRFHEIEIFKGHTEIPDAIDIFNNILKKKRSCLGKTPNKFLIFFTSIQAILKGSGLERNNVARIASATWKNASKDIKSYFENLFNEVRTYIVNAKRPTNPVQADFPSLCTNYCDGFSDTTKHSYSYDAYLDNNKQIFPLSQMSFLICPESITGNMQIFPLSESNFSIYPEYMQMLPRSQPTIFSQSSIQGNLDYI
ncbi:13114_t:CDS:2 [Ambispora gerdemannii]|uniref:13114_t:CDS:1 n=1 Tax=Ambispora gerdemannii TaxID=144530 RepID=A0A9N9BN23_9GLOM|nr:13114_t:CDS:2 [Ambispora gerdemannii]